jgi:hypothetical protein
VHLAECTKSFKTPWLFCMTTSIGAPGFRDDQYSTWPTTVVRRRNAPYGTDVPVPSLCPSPWKTPEAEERFAQAEGKLIN